MQNNDFIKVLVVEDDPLVSLDLTDRLERLGFTDIVCYDTGEEAIANFGEDEPSVVIMDIALAGDLDGVETAAQLRKQRDVPVIFLTSNVDENTFQRALMVQPAAFLHKPFIDIQVSQNIKVALLHKAGDHDDRTKRSKNAPVLVPDGLFVLKREGRFDKIAFDSVRYLKAGRSYCEIHIVGDDPVVVTHSMKTVFEIIEQSPGGDNFVKIHRSYVVNTSFIDGFEPNFLHLGKESLPVSNAYLPSLKKRFFTL